MVISGIGPAADPYAWLRERWAAQIAEAEAAAATVPPALHVPVPPLQPTYYHVEMTDNEGGCTPGTGVLLAPAAACG